MLPLIHELLIHLRVQRVRLHRIILLTVPIEFSFIIRLGACVRLHEMRSQSRIPSPE